MSLSKELVERFQADYINKNDVVIGYTEAESQLKETSRDEVIGWIMGKKV